MNNCKWIKSEEQLPELVLSPNSNYSFSNDVLLYGRDENWIAYLEYDSSNMLYCWIYEGGYKMDTIDTYWMPLPPSPEVN